MIPIVISTYPENGSSDAALNKPIRITFAGSLNRLTVTSKNIKLENLNRALDVPLTFGSEDGSDEITIIPNDNGEGILYGLTAYKLTVSGLRSGLGELMQGSYSLEFMTVPGEPGDVSVSPVELEIFEIINTYPKDDGYGVTPDSIKVRFNKTLVGASVNNDSFFVTTDPIEITDIGFISPSTVSGTITVSGKDILFVPVDDLSDNTRYNVVLSGIASEEGFIAPSVMFSFYTEFTPAFSDIKNLQSTFPFVAAIAKEMGPVEILTLIRSNSEEAQWIAEQSEITDIDWANPPRYVQEYVKAKTRYDIVFDKYLQLAGSSTSKELGDLSIEYGHSLKDLLDFADRLKRDYQRWENMIKGSASGKVGPRPFRKGENIDEDPDFMNRQLKDWEGTKGW